MHLGVMKVKLPKKTHLQAIIQITALVVLHFKVVPTWMVSH